MLELEVVSARSLAPLTGMLISESSQLQPATASTRVDSYGNDSVPPRYMVISNALLWENEYRCGLYVRTEEVVSLLVSNIEMNAN